MTDEMDSSSRFHALPQPVSSQVLEIHKKQIS